MAKCYKPPIYNCRGLQTQWMNLIFQSHELICGCNDPIEHATQLSKCHPTTTTTGEEDGQKEQPGGEEDVLLPGDLDKLFEEDVFDEENTG